MKGQWIGCFAGTTASIFVINIDVVGTCFQRFAYLIQDNSQLPNPLI